MVGDLLECAYTQTFYLSHAATRGVTQLIDRIGDSNGERGIYVYGHSEGTLIANRGVSDVSDNTSYKKTIRTQYRHCKQSGSDRNL